MKRINGPFCRDHRLPFPAANAYNIRMPYGREKSPPATDHQLGSGPTGRYTLAVLLQIGHLGRFGQKMRHSYPGTERVDASRFFALPMTIAGHGFECFRQSKKTSWPRAPQWTWTIGSHTVGWHRQEGCRGAGETHAGARAISWLPQPGAVEIVFAAAVNGSIAKIWR